MVLTIFLTVIFTLTYVAGWSAFLSNNRGDFRSWLFWLISPISIPSYVLILGLSILVTSRR